MTYGDGVLTITHSDCFAFELVASIIIGFSLFLHHQLLLIGLEAQHGIRFRDDLQCPHLPRPCSISARGPT